MMTLDELLGTKPGMEPDNKDPKGTEERNTRFPSYEDFRARSNGYNAPRMQQDMREQVNYNQNIGYSAPAALAQQREYEDDYAVRTRPQNFYDYVAHQKNMASDVELMEKLSRSNDGVRPTFNANQSQQMTAVFEDTKSGQKHRSRLNTKGKIVLGSFLALVVTVVSLVIGFAGKINAGTAVVPASNANATSIVSTQTSNF